MDWWVCGEDRVTKWAHNSWAFFYSLQLWRKGGHKPVPVVRADYTVVTVFL